MRVNAPANGLGSTALFPLVLEFQPMKVMSVVGTVSVQHQINVIAQVARLVQCATFLLSPLALE